jgi:C-terminal processing protease CtpA/Prc
VNAVGPEGEPVGELGARIARTFDAERLERVVLDLRWNGGGDNTTFGPLVGALKANAGIDRQGVLFALVGRATFSAAGNLVTVLERDTRAILVGEPTGGAPNQYGDSQPLALAHHPELLVFVSTRYHAFGGPADARLTHEPDIALPPRAADYFAGRDPALDRALGLAGD